MSHDVYDQKPIGIETRDRKSKWIEHTLRKDANEIWREDLDWNPLEKRRRGRPRDAWRRILEADMYAVDKQIALMQVKINVMESLELEIFHSGTMPPRSAIATLSKCSLPTGILLNKYK